jgi:oligoribonuclease NrnB/cAMP/cGMP phosphodiesterase (DHH superfamily)
MRIVTRPDFDGVVCAALLYEAEDIEGSVKWVEPNEIQKGLVDVREGDIIANLPYDERCSLWFDHHHSNRIDKPFKGSFKIAPSAAGIVYAYYKDRFERDYSELVTETDKIDSANLSLDEVLHPEKYSYVLLSMTVLGKDEVDETYWDNLVEYLRKYDIDKVISFPEVEERCRSMVAQNKRFKGILQNHTKLIKHVSITDFRSFGKAPTGNRFLVYSLFPEAIVSVKIRHPDNSKEKVSVSVGHSIFNRKCNVNVGHMLSRFEGGGHRGAGSCTFHVSKAEEYITSILDILLKNEPIS